MIEHQIPYHSLAGVKFALYSAEEIRQLSVKEITNPQSFDALLHPTYGGLYDPALGAAERNDVCGTCGLNNIHCPGHMGHINLPLPVYNPTLFRMMFSLLKGTCFSCHRLLMKPSQMFLFSAQLRALKSGLLTVVDTLQQVYDGYMGEHGSDADFDGGAREAVEECLTRALKEMEEASTDMSSVHVKHIVEYRQKLIRRFLSGAYFVKATSMTCPHCHLAQRALKSEHTCKIFFYKSLTKAQMKSFILHKREQGHLNVSETRPKPVDEEAPDDELVDLGDTSMNTSKQSPQRSRIFKPTDKEIKDINKSMEKQAYLTPMEVRRHLREVWENDSSVLQQVFGALSLSSAEGRKHPTDVFFLEVLPVVPSRFRPVSVMGDKRFENAQSANMSKVIADTLTIRDILVEMKTRSLAEDTETLLEQSESVKGLPGSTMTEKLQLAWLRMQVQVNCIMDSDLDRLNQDKSPGIRQLLEKKEGLFRKNMMGKRVNFAARSVISPDPYISTNEIGIPEVFAKKLTFPQPITPWNFKELKQAVINGPDEHPGAIFVENENGSRQFLSGKDRTSREAIAKQLLTTSPGNSHIYGAKKVHRHLKNGDVLLLNRQPTLHKPSIQAHKARVLPGEKTLRLHYANCKAYNADFDGDEMNAHFPQDEVSRAEAYTIACTDFNYLGPKDGTPLAGLIQDHMVSGVKLTMRGRFFPREDYQQLVYCALTDKRGRIQFLPPAIVKPRTLWSGKQVLSTVLLNTIPDGKAPLNLTGKAKIAAKSWITETPRCNLGKDAEEMSESYVVIRDGQLLVGILDKAHYGPTPYGLVHCCYEVYGGQVAGQLLTCLAKLFTTFLQYHGFTLGVHDILCTKQADQKRKKIMESSTLCGPEVVVKAFGGDVNDEQALKSKVQAAQFTRGGEGIKDLDLSMKGKTDEFTNDIAKVCMPMGLVKLFPDNNLQLMVQSGAKGSAVNCMQISCLLGQIELEGARPPLMLSGKSLPSFLPYDSSPRAGGFIDGRFLTGIQPPEYFFHCMAGREGLVDTAVKTSRSGYLQRCIIKHLEGLTIAYDMTVRDSDGSVVQFQYGEDSLEVLKTKFLNPKQFPFMIQNQHSLAPKRELKEVRRKLNSDDAIDRWKMIKKWKKRNPNDTKGLRRSAFLKYCNKKMASVIEDISASQVSKVGRSAETTKICDLWAQMAPEKRKKYGKKLSPCPDPVLAGLHPARNFGAISEKFDNMIESYLTSNPDKLISDERSGQRGAISADRFRSLLCLRHLHSLVSPGEAVGLLAAQSIGEPSTQMTLNTFHFAGRGEMNVTLGIPRLREILTVASAQIKTPSMDIPVLNSSKARKRSKVLQRKLNKVYLSQVLENFEVEETWSVQQRSDCSRVFRVRFNFLPPELYASDCVLTPARILYCMERRFIRFLHDSIKKKATEQASAKLISTALNRSKAGTRQAMKAANVDDEEFSDSGEADNDATSNKHRLRQLDDNDYEGEEEEKDELGGGEAAESENEDDLEDTFIEGDNLANAESDTLRPVSPVEKLTQKKSPKKKQKAQIKPERVAFVLSHLPIAIKYTYDAEEEMWCEVTLREDTEEYDVTDIDLFPLSQTKVDLTSLIDLEVKRFVVYQTQGLNRCFLTEGKKAGEQGKWRVKTEGVNIQEMYNYSKVLDLNALYTNDVHAMAAHYGIEAAARVIIKEVCDVFAAYGIEVDYRHLSLVADYMTFEGVYKPFNRVGIESNPSPIQKMSFETTMHFLRAAAIAGDHDDLKSPSSRLVVGKLVSGGTGCFGLELPLH